MMFVLLIIEGLISYGQVNVSSPYIKNLDVWKDLGAHVTTSNEAVVEDSDIIFLAIKPVIFPSVMAQLQSSPRARNIKNKLFVSILAGITLNDLEKVGRHFYKTRLFQKVCVIDIKNSHFS